jgi:hypothetical protein
LEGLVRVVLTAPLNQLDYEAAVEMTAMVMVR